MSKRMTESQIVAVLKEVDARNGSEGSLPQAWYCCFNFSIKWCTQYGGMEVSDVVRLAGRRNRRLKQMYAGLSLKSQMQEDIIKSFNDCS